MSMTNTQCLCGTVKLFDGSSEIQEIEVLGDWAFMCQRTFDAELDSSAADFFPLPLNFVVRPEGSS